MNTFFSSVYTCFLGKITDDMYLELTPEDTIKDLQQLLIDSIPLFEFPRKNISSYVISRDVIEEEFVTDSDFVINTKNGLSEVDRSAFLVELSQEEINILGLLMMSNWLQRQITSIENIRMKYSGSDFKLTSQANHLSKLLALSTEVHRQSHHAQRLYGRRMTDTDGSISSNWKVFRRGL